MQIMIGGKKMKQKIKKKKITLFEPRILEDITLPGYTRAFMNTGAILPTSTVHANNKKSEKTKEI